MSQTSIAKVQKSDQKPGDSGQNEKVSRTDSDSGGEEPTPKSNSTNSSESSDLRQCATLRKSAESACDYTDSTDSASDAQGLQATCEQGTSKGLKNSQAKTAAAKDCSTKFAQCKQTCSEFADTYSESDNFDTFNSNARACLALASKAESLNDSSSSLLDFAQSSLNCSSNSSQSPQSAGGDSNSKSSDATKTAASEAACAANPQSPGCASGAAAQSAGALAASGGFGDSSTPKGSLDVGDTTGATVSNPFASPDGGTGGGAPAKNATIANNSGGSIPNSGGSHAGGGGGLLQSAMNAVKSTIADIDRGLRGGGFAANGAAEKPEGSAEASPIAGGDAGDGRSLASVSGALKGADLKRYLPGGDLGPPKPLPPEIRDQYHGAGADIFESIHIRYELKCKLGELFDCR